MDVAEPRHRLLAILAADAAGYSRLMSIDARTTLQALESARARMSEVVGAHHGRIVDTAGDSMLAVFDSTGAAIHAAQAFQQAWSGAQGDAPHDRRLAFRIGVHLGDVIEKADGSVYGNGVNVAARLQALAGPGEVWVSDAVRVSVAGLSGLRLEDRGAHTVKNIAEPVRAYRVRTRDHVASEAAAVRPGLRLMPRRLALSLALIASIGVAAWAIGAALTWTKGRTGNAGLRPASIVVGRFAASDASASAAARATRFQGALVAALTAPSHRKMLSTQALEDVQASAGATSALARARWLGARYLLDGQLRRVDDHDTATLSLVDTETGVQVWSAAWPPDPQPGQPASTPAMRELADAVAARVLDQETRRVMRLPVEQLAPVELVLRGASVYEARPTLPGIDEALPHADRALALNPEFLPALNLKAFLLLNRYDEEANPDHDRYAREVDDLTARMLALDAKDPYTWSLRASAMSHAGRWGAAAEAVEQLLQIEGPTTFALIERANVWLRTGRVAEALQVVQAEPLRSSPDAWTPVMECHALLLLAQLQAAVDACERAIGRSAMLWSAHLYLAAAHALLGRHEQARASLQVVERMSPGHTIARLRAYRQWAHPEYQRLAAATYYDGLRKAGLPER